MVRLKRPTAFNIQCVCVCVCVCVWLCVCVYMQITLGNCMHACTHHIAKYSGGKCPPNLTNFNPFKLHTFLKTAC